jgi:hypothetical protein
MTEKTTTAPRNCVLTVKITADERAELVLFAGERCVNVSALVRKLLFGQLRKGGAESPPAVKSSIRL